MPILGMIGVILGVPPQMSSDSANMTSLVGYLVIVIVGVIFLVWNANRLYGSLYGRLTEVEVQASRIERDLGDPARLLTELASEGLDISSIINQPKANVAASGEASSSEVINWDEDVNLLMEEEESVTEIEDIQETISPDTMELDAPDSLEEVQPEEQPEEQPDEQPDEQPEERVSNLNIDDLFGDESEGVRNDD